MWRTCSRRRSWPYGGQLVVTGRRTPVAAGRGGRGGLDRRAGWPPSPHRPGDDHFPAALGPSAGQLGDAVLRSLRGRGLRGDRPAGHLGRPDLVAARRRAAAIVAFSAAGFAVGAFFPGRFAAPLVAIAALFVPQIGVLALQRHQAWSWVSFARDATVPGTGVFCPFHAGLSIVQIMFMAGVAAVALGVLARAATAGGRHVGRAGALIALAGLAAAGTGLALAGTARQEAQGILIPALQGSASDKLSTYAPACDH